jgi:hypothetical protein
VVPGRRDRGARRRPLPLRADHGLAVPRDDRRCAVLEPVTADPPGRCAISAEPGIEQRLAENRPTTAPAAVPARTGA